MATQYLSSAPQPTQSRQHHLKQLEASNRQLLTALPQLTQAYTAPLQSQMQSIHSNSAALQKQTRQLDAEVNRLSRQTREWSNVVGTAVRGLNEIGDVQNWAEVIERELAIVEETLRMVEEGEEGSL